MPTHVLRPRYWAEQLERLLPTLRNNDTLLVPELYCKAAIDLQFEKCGITKRIHVRTRAVNGSTGDGAECYRCRWLLANGFRQQQDIARFCECTLHDQDCPALWREVDHDEWRAALQRTPALAQLEPIADYSQLPCNCGGDEIAKMFLPVQQETS